VALCRAISLLGISALRLSLPYHDLRMPPETKRADYAVSSNLARTIDATRQAVIDIRSCLDWFQQQGYEKRGIVGTSLGCLRVSDQRA
jgi:dienelactone hydrolase